MNIRLTSRVKNINYNVSVLQNYNIITNLILNNRPSNDNFFSSSNTICGTYWSAVFCSSYGL